MSVVYLSPLQDEEFLGDVSGNMNIPSITRPANGDGSPEFNTLDEPIRDTIVSMNSVIAIGHVK